MSAFAWFCGFLEVWLGFEALNRPCLDLKEHPNFLDKWVWSCERIDLIVVKGEALPILNG